MGATWMEAHTQQERWYDEMILTVAWTNLDQPRGGNPMYQSTLTQSSDLTNLDHPGWILGDPTVDPDRI